MCYSWSYAQEVTYSPEFVDTFLIQNTQDVQMSQIALKMSAIQADYTTCMGRASLKVGHSTPAVILILPVMKYC